jgi:hypothetical protein
MRSLRSLLAAASLAAVALAALPSAASADQAACAQAPPSLVNGSFEYPANPPASYRFWPAANAGAPTPGIGWATTDPTRMVEIWSTGFLGVPSLAGSQYAS